MTPPRLELRQLTTRFGTLTALERVDLQLTGGEIHALLGENGAGKTTLVNALAGLVPPDSGSILVDGRPARIHSPHAAREHGIGVVHQHFTLIPTLSAAENLALALHTRPGLRLDRSRYAREVERLGRSVGLAVPANLAVDRLSVGDRQRLEILLALAASPRILVLDEPTASLTPQEVRDLLQVLRRLGSQGTSVLFISHKLDEALTAARRVTVLRGGRVVGSLETSGVKPAELARLMVGELPRPESRAGGAGRGPVLLRARGLTAGTSTGAGRLRGVNLELVGGEILGVAGVDGNGQTELAEALAGLRPFTGSVELGGRALRPHRADEATRLGLAHIPGDRLARGLVAGMSVRDNLMLRHWHRGELRLGPFLRRGAVDRFVDDCLGRYGIRASSARAPARTLSGGNQQRLLVARELELDPMVLVAVNPSRGLDVAATREVHRRLRDTRAEGKAVLLVSTDLDEVLELSDRVTVMHRGVLREVAPDERGAEAIGLLMGGVAAPRNGPEAPQGGLEAPQGGLDAPQGGLDAPRGGAGA